MERIHLLNVRIVGRVDIGLVIVSMKLRERLAFCVGKIITTHFLVPKRFVSNAIRSAIWQSTVKKLMSSNVIDVA